MVENLAERGPLASLGDSLGNTQKKKLEKWCWSRIWMAVPKP